MRPSLVALAAFALVGGRCGFADPAAGRPFESEAWSIPANGVDTRALAALQKEGLEPARPCSDEVFLRRVTVDVTGTLPEPAEVRQFLQDGRPDKRAALIEDLLQREGFAEYWTLKWGDLLRVKAEFPINLWPNAVQAYHRWIYVAVRENRPYDQFVRELLTSSGSNFRVPPVNFYRAVQGREPAALAEAVALTFMGTRLATWPAERRAGMAAFFSRVAYKKTDEWKEGIVYPDLTATAPLEAVFPDGTKTTIAPGDDPRVAFANWLITPTNPWFTRNIANRVCAWLLGRGIIHEPDDIRPDNPPANPELLTYLEKELVGAKYDLRHLYRLILNSRTYQQSSIPRSASPRAEALFAYYPVRRLDAEVLIDALDWVGGTGENYSSAIPEPFTYIPGDQRTIALPDGSISSAFLEMFGRPARDTGLESERSNQLTDAQRLYLLNSADVHRRISRSPRLRMIAAGGNRDEVVRGVYLTILSRDPTPAELAAADKYWQTPGLRAGDAATDLAWALVNTMEFCAGTEDGGFRFQVGRLHKSRRSGFQPDTGPALSGWKPDLRGEGGSETTSGSRLQVPGWETAGEARGSEETDMGDERATSVVSRRDLLKQALVGAAGLAFLDGTSLWAAAPEAKPAAKLGKAKAVIQLWLWGGPSHLDTWDPKPQAGYDYCGPLNSPIETNVPGIRISQLLPLLAQQADKYSIIRSMTHGNNGHETAAYIVQTGRQPGDRLVYPCLGAVVSRFEGYDQGYTALVPPYMVLTTPQGRFDEAGFLGPRYRPFATGGDPAAQRFVVSGIVAEGMTDERQRDRRELLHSVDTLKQSMPQNPQAVKLDATEAKAYDMILGDAGKLFDLAQEKDALRQQYGRNTFGQSCLMARRLVATGVPYVTINYGGWDTHKQHFETMRWKLPEMDRGMATLLQDLTDHGLLDSTIVWWSGEFGRTPKIDWGAPWNGGRSHYGQCFSAVVAGGGFKGGQVVGASDAKGEQVAERPVSPQDLLGSMYQLLGIDPDGPLPSPRGMDIKVMPLDEKPTEGAGRLKEIM